MVDRSGNARKGGRFSISTLQVSRLRRPHGLPLGLHLRPVEDSPPQSNFGLPAGLQPGSSAEAAALRRCQRTPPQMEIQFAETGKCAAVSHLRHGSRISRPARLRSTGRCLAAKRDRWEPRSRIGYLSTSLWLPVPADVIRDRLETQCKYSSTIARCLRSSGLEA